MGAGTGVGAPAQQRVPSVSRAVETLRTELDDPAMTILAIASLTLLTFTAVRITGGAPSALMELGYAPVALAAYAFGSRGGLAIGIVVGAILGPLPALLGFSGVEGPAEWLIRVSAYAGVGTVIGAMLGRTAVDAGEIHAG